MKALVLMLTITIGAISLTYAIIKCRPIPLSEYNPHSVATPKEKAAMRYHGIRFAETLPDGTLVFYRGGQQCRLFTKEFLRVWER